MDLAIGIELFGICPKSPLNPGLGAKPRFMVGGWHYQARSGRVRPVRCPAPKLAIGRFSCDRKPARMECPGFQFIPFPATSGSDAFSPFLSLRRHCRRFLL